MKIQGLMSIAVLSLLSLLTACGETSSRRSVERLHPDEGDGPEQRHIAAPAPEAQAPADISESFSISTESPSSESLNKVRIAIRKDSLGKEFLLQSGLTIMPYLASSNSLLSRIVVFRKIEGELWMFEASKGLVVTDAVPQTFVLAKFPIVAETEDDIAFDFNKGMSSLFVSSEWRASDMESRIPQAEISALPTRLSYLEEARIKDSSELVVRQIAQLDTSAGSIDQNLKVEFSHNNATVEIRYYLTPYQPDPEFTPSEASDFISYGFFEAAPIYDGKGTPVIHATKFGNGPIEFAISANTPAAVKGAVREGILYWNLAFGEERIKVVDAPEGVSAPDFNHNIVQWVDWEDAGFAYADAQVDPRTGQTLHAQVYMTSVFWISGQKSAKSLVDRFFPRQTKEVSTAQGRMATLRQNEQAASFQPPIALSGFGKPHLCMAERTEDFALLIKDAVEAGASDKRIEQIALDYIREVVAHEIGHTLGLRHNFAGSLNANFDSKDMDILYRHYVTTGSVPAEIRTSTTVMDYQTFMNSTVTGSQIRSSVLPYDLAAIKQLYTGEETEPGDGEGAMLFCTDSMVKTYIDCRRFDQGPSVAGSIVRDQKASVASLSEMVQLTTGLQPRIYFMSPQHVLKSLLEPSKEAMKIVSANNKLIRFRGVLGSPLGLEPDIRAAELSHLAFDVLSNGGFDAVLPLSYALPKSSLFPNGDQHLDVLVKKELVGILAGEKTALIPDSLLGELFTAHLAKFADLVVLAEADGSIDVVIEDGSAAELGDGESLAAEQVTAEQVTITRLPTFKYPDELRAQAAGLLAAERGEAIDFGMDERFELASTLKAKLDTSLGQDILAVDAMTLPKEARRWVLENRKVLGALGLK